MGPAEQGGSGAAVACTTGQTLLGEGARWDAHRSELLRVDILAGHVYRDCLDQVGGLIPVRTYQIPGTVGAVTTTAGSSLPGRVSST